MNKIHDKIVLKMGVSLFESTSNNVIELGDLLLKLESDKLTDAGFWIWDYVTNEVYYSPKFCEKIGYSYGDFGNDTKGFDLANKEQMAIGMEMLNNLIDNKSELIFINNIEYTSKDGSIKKFICSGTVFYKDGETKYILGTHKLF